MFGHRVRHEASTSNVQISPQRDGASLATAAALKRAKRGSNAAAASTPAAVLLQPPRSSPRCDGPGAAAPMPLPAKMKKTSHASENSEHLLDERERAAWGTHEQHTLISATPCSRSPEPLTSRSSSAAPCAKSSRDTNDAEGRHGSRVLTELSMPAISGESVLFSLTAAANITASARSAVASTACAGLLYGS
eukprot:scaffold76740_cov28-Tisochrysis_lutea.AAC.4